MITYPASLDTNFKKLCAIYSLLEQMRLEHNRQGAIARSNWKEYQGKWQEYAKIFSVKQSPLLTEQCRLRTAIRKQAYSDKAWALLTTIERDQAFDLLYGDKQSLKNTITLATTNLLGELRKIDLLSLTGQAVDPVEDFSSATYVEYDPYSQITKTATRVEATSLISANGDCYVYKDFGASYFGASFSHLLTVMLTYANNWGSVGFNWTLSNYVGKWVTGEGIGFTTEKGNNVYSIRLYERYDSSQQTDYYNISISTAYYLTVARTVGTDLTVKIYSDAARTNLLDTLALTLNRNTSYRYLYPLQAQGSGAGGDYWKAYTENLDLQEAGGLSVPISTYYMLRGIR